MYSLKVIAHSASGKSIFASVTKQSGMFKSIIATGNIAVVDGNELPKVGDIIALDGVSKVSVRTQVSDENQKEFNWLVLE